MIPQAMLAKWLHDFISHIAAMLPEPNRPPPPPLPTYGGDFASTNALDDVRKWGVQFYAGYPAKVQAIQGVYDWMRTSPGPLLPIPQIP